MQEDKQKEALASMEQVQDGLNELKKSNNNNKTLKTLLEKSGEIMNNLNDNRYPALKDFKEDLTELEADCTAFKDSLNAEDKKEDNPDKEKITDVIKAIEVLFEMMDNWVAAHISPTGNNDNKTKTTPKWVGETTNGAELGPSPAQSTTTVPGFSSEG